jgi:DNA-binding transcriptional LysR family regulator
MTGRDFLPKVRRLIDEFETSVLAIHDLGARSSGLVSVAAVPSAVFGFLPRAIGRFTEVYPRIRIRILDIGAVLIATGAGGPGADDAVREAREPKLRAGLRLGWLTSANIADRIGVAI